MSYKVTGGTTLLSVNEPDPSRQTESWEVVPPALIARTSNNGGDKAGLPSRRLRESIV